MSQHKSETQVLNPPVKGKKSFMIGGTPVEVDDRYEVTQMIGSGAYGIVYSAKDLKTNEDVAIKQIKTAFDSVVDAKRILREIKILSKYHKPINRFTEVLTT